MNLSKHLTRATPGASRRLNALRKPFDARPLVTVAVTAWLAVGAATSAHAAAITQYVELTDPFRTAAGPGSTGFSQFDPALGTLSSVSFQYTVNGVNPYAAFVGTAGDYLFYSLYDPSWGTQLAKASFQFGFNGSAGIGMSFLASSDTHLLQYIGTGTKTLMASFSRSNYNNWVSINGDCVVASCSDLTPRVAITYDYIAANAVPEPPTLALSLASLALVGWLSRRRA